MVASWTLPTVPFGNVKPSVELSAEVFQGEDLDRCVEALQATAQRYLVAWTAQLKKLQQ